MILKILLIVFSILTSLTVIHRIRKARMQIDDAVFWVLFSLVLIVLALFPGLVYRMTDITGMQSPANLLFLVIIFVLIVKIFSMSIKISVLESKIAKLVQNEALKEVSDSSKVL